MTFIPIYLMLSVNIRTRNNLRTNSAGTTKFKGDIKEVGMTWRVPEPNTSKNYGSVLCPLYSQELRFEQYLNLTELYRKSIYPDVERNERDDLQCNSEVNTFYRKEWYLSHHPVLKAKTPNKVRRVSNTAAKKETYA